MSPSSIKSASDPASDSGTPELLTFLVPSYNYGRYLSNCLSSIVSQTYPHLEIIILDDHSTDETPALVAEWTARDSRIRGIRHEENKGHLANYNVGIEQAQGDFIWLISADDQLAAPTIAARFMSVFQQHPEVSFAFSRVQCMDDQGTPYAKWIPNPKAFPLVDTSGIITGNTFFNALLKGNFVPAPGAVARKACYDEWGLFHPELTHSGDWFNWLLFALSGDVYFEADTAVYYRKHPNNMHQTYQDPRQGVENSLRCLALLAERLQQTTQPQLKNAYHQTQKALCHFKYQHGFPQPWPERTFAWINQKLEKRFKK